MPFLLTEAKLLLSAHLKTHPTAFRAIATLRQTHKKRLVGPHTDIVIEGFWRSANHYATYAFKVAQQGKADIAHHFHAPAQILLADRWGVPSITLIRRPDDAAASAAVYLGWLDPAVFLKMYVLFYRPLVPLRERLVIGDFAVVTERFGDVIDRVNKRYQRTFNRFSGAVEEESAVREMIREEHTAHMGADVRKAPLPSDEKKRLKEAVYSRLHGSRYASLLREACELYECLTEGQ